METTFAVMSNRNIFWLCFGIGFGVLLHYLWTQQQRVCMALANHESRIASLEFECRQRLIQSSSAKDKVKQVAWVLTLGSVALKLVLFVLQHVRY